MIQSVVHDPQVAGDNLVLQDGPCRDVNSLPVVGDDDHSSFQTDLGGNTMTQRRYYFSEMLTHVFAQSDVTRNGQMIQLQHIRNTGEPL